MIMKKKRNAHNDDTGSLAMPSGYATNANPGPTKSRSSFVIDIHVSFMCIWQFYKI